jgi:hypothetical protein
MSALSNAFRSALSPTLGPKSTGRLLALLPCWLLLQPILLLTFLFAFSPIDFCSIYSLSVFALLCILFVYFLVKLFSHKSSPVSRHAIPTATLRYPEAQNGSLCRYIMPTSKESQMNIPTSLYSILPEPQVRNESLYCPVRPSKKPATSESTQTPQQPESHSFSFRAVFFQLLISIALMIITRCVRLLNWELKTAFTQLSQSMPEALRDLEGRPQRDQSLHFSCDRFSLHIYRVKNAKITSLSVWIAFRLPGKLTTKLDISLSRDRRVQFRA